MSSEDAEMTAAVLKLQAIARGRAARRESELLRDQQEDEAPQETVDQPRDDTKGVRIAPPEKVQQQPKQTRAEAHKAKVDKQRAELERPEINNLGDQHAWVMERVKGVSRKLDTEQRLWEAVEKLSDIAQLQRAQIDQLSKSQGRFQHKNRTRESMAIEESMMSLKRREAAELTKRRQEFERLIEHSSVTLNTVRNQLVEEQSEHQKTVELLQDQELQAKHAVDAFKEVQSWLDDANRKVKKLDDEVREFELAKQTLDDHTKDMQTKVENLHHDISTRDEAVEDREKRAARLKAELDNMNNFLGKEKDENKRLTNQISVNNSEASAEHSRLKNEIQHLKAEIEVLLERTKRWEDFDKLCPDFKELEAQLEAKDEVLHRAKQVIAKKLADEETLINKARLTEASMQKLIGDLAKIEDTLDNVVTATEVNVGQVCVEKTLIGCYPDPCPVGRELHLVVTTVDSTGHPVRGVNSDEFTVQQLFLPPTGGSVVGEDYAIEDVLDNERSSSTFTCSYITEAEGRSGFKVQFRGQTFFASVNVPAPSPMHLALEAEAQRKPRFTVHCTPNTVAVGQEMDVAVVVRQQGSLLPARFCNLDVDSFRVTPYSTAQGVALPNPLKQIPGMPIFKTTVPIGDLSAQGVPRDYIGIEVMIHGGTDAARGSVKLVSDPRNDTEWDPNSTTITCTPDPVSIGDEVLVTVTARNNYWVPLSMAAVLEKQAEDARPPQEEEEEETKGPKVIRRSVAPLPLLTAKGSSTRIEQPTLVKGPSQVFVGKMFPSETGRCGVSVTMGGLHIGSASVTVKLPEKWDPTKTILEVKPAVVPAGETMHVSLITCDSHGRYCPGPEPTAFRLTPLSAATTVLPLRREEGVESHYVTTVRTTLESTYTTGGVTVDFEGVTLTKKVRIGGERLDITVDEKPSECPGPCPPRFSVTYGADPVAPGSVIPVLITVTQDNPAQDRRKAIQTPVVRPTINAELAGDVTAVPGARYVWKCLVKVGDALGTSSIEVDIEGQKCTASTTVAGSVTESFAEQVERLQELEIRIRDLVRNTEEREKDLDDRSKDLDKREADLRMKEEEAAAAAAANEAEEEQPQHLLFGVMLSDGVQYGAQWDAIDGAKVVEVHPGGPLDAAHSKSDLKVEAGDILKEVQWEDTYGYVHTCTVRQMDDFKRICRMLARQGQSFVPTVTLTFLKITEEVCRVAVHPGQTPEPPGRSVGTRRHPSKSIDASFCSSPPPGTSPARSR